MALFVHHHHTTIIITQPLGVHCCLITNMTNHNFAKTTMC